MADNAVAVNITAETSGFLVGVQRVKEQALSLKAQLSGTFSGMSAGLRESLDGLENMRSSLRGMTELVAAAFAVEEIKHFVESMAEAGEKTLNTAFLFGTTVEKLGELQARFILAGGSADDAERTFIKLGRTFQNAIENPAGSSAVALRNLHFTQAQVVAGSKDLSEALRLVVQNFYALEPQFRDAGLLAEVTGRGIKSLEGILREGPEGWDANTAAAKAHGEMMAQVAPKEDEVAKKLNELKLKAVEAGQQGFMLLGPDIDFAIGFLKTFVGWIEQAKEGINHFLGAVQEANKLGLQMHQWLFGGPDLTLPETTVTAPALPRGGGGPAGTEKPGRGGGGAKGQATEMELWTEQLQKQLMAENEFFKDSTAEELAFWQSKLALTKNGSKEQYEVEQKIFALRKALAHQTEAEKEAEIEADKRVSDAKYQRAVALVQSEERLGKISSAQAVAEEESLVDKKWAADQAYYAKKTAAAQGDSKTQQRIANDEKVAYQAMLTEKQHLAETAALQIQQTWQTTLKPAEDSFATFMDDIIFRTKSVAQAFDDMLKSILESMLKAAMQGLFNGLLFGGSAGGGAGGGGLIGQAGSAAGSAVSGGGILSGLLGLGSAAGSVASGASAAAGFFGTGGGLDVLSGAFASASAAGATGGIGAYLGTLASFLPFFGAARGGIVSARGGWTVPSFASGGIPSILHPNEMVLPAHISQFVQDAAARGGGGGGHTFNLNISAMDGASVMRAGPALVASINRAMRNGSVGYANG